jgi:hypothetical protein
MSFHSILLVRPLINIERNAPFFLPLGLLCCASPLRDAGFPVEILDYEYLLRRGAMAVPDDETWIADLCEPIIEKAPVILGLTALADTMPACLLMGRYLKQVAPEIIIVIGGPGVFGTTPEIGNRFGDCFDYLCINEGEVALVELAVRVAANDLGTEVPGLWSPHVTEPAVPYQGFAEIDELPMPAYDLLPIADYVEMATPRIFDVYLGTGCTYACKFCVTSTFWNRTFRAKSPQTVLAELDYLYDNFGITKFNFLHDNFANKKDYLESFIDYFQNNNQRYEWGCAVRPDNVTAPQLRAMRSAGCTMIFCGTDSGSKRILKSMAKMTKVTKSYDFFENCRDADIAFETNAIIGFPHEDDTDFEETLTLVIDAVAHGATNSDVSVLQPLPGAQVTKDNSDTITWVGPSLQGAFLPPQVLDLAENNADIFTGFAFIRNGNRSFAFYREATQLVRYFTRHYFRTVYFLKERCGVTYLSIFEAMMAANEGTPLETTFAQVFSDLDLTDEQRSLAAAVFALDQATEAAKGLHVSTEIANIYARAHSQSGAQSHALITVDHEVHGLFAALPESITHEAPHAITRYLVFRTAEDQLVTIKLSGWQMRLWSALAAKTQPDDAATTVAAELADRGIDRDRADVAVNRAAALFADVLQIGATSSPVLADTRSP